ncbi:uncharacterized protein VTP21DRAFT_11693 [Calcarisporiella thermophila]|uniref:uncharacterized protein n=1 Tax=Calcarisporiella thermophila TaxID=911321 RepID=UPI003742EB4B
MSKSNPTLSELTVIEHKGKELHVGDYVHIKNKYNPNKPNVGHIFALWVDQKGKKGVRVCWYLHPEQTVHRATQKFMEHEVFKSSGLEDVPISEVLDQCYVLPVRDYIRGHPKGAPPDAAVYVCESRYVEPQKHFTKIKNWAASMPEGVKELEIEPLETPRQIRKVHSTLVEQEKEKEKVRDQGRSPSAPSTPGASGVDNRGGLPSGGLSEAIGGMASPTKQAQARKEAMRLPFVCSYGKERGVPCNRSFATSKELQVHLSSHLSTRTPRTPLPQQQQQQPYPHLQPQQQQYPPQPHLPQPQPHLRLTMSSQPVPTPQPSLPQAQPPMGFPQLSQNIVNRFRHTSDGQLMWFAAPPLDVVPLTKPKLSEDYLAKREELAERRNKRKAMSELVDPLWESWREEERRALLESKKGKRVESEMIIQGLNELTKELGGNPDDALVEL